MESYNSLNSLRFVLTICSLHNIKYVSKFTVNRWPFLKVTITLLLTGLPLGYTMFIHFSVNIFVQSSPSIIMTDAVISLLSYLQYITDFYFVYTCSIRMCIYYNVFDEMDKVLSMKYCKKIKQKVFSMTVLFLLLWLGASLGEYVAWSFQFGWFMALIYAANYFMALVRILTLLDMNSQILHIKYRLITIADKIEEFESFVDDGEHCIKIVENKRSKIKKGTKIAPFIQRCSIDLAKLNSYYLLLLDQTRFLNSLFGFRVRYSFK